jgi:hypothetical protein
MLYGISADSTQETIVERYETLQLGVAVTTGSILNMPRFELLDGTLRDRLAKHGLLNV